MSLNECLSRGALVALLTVFFLAAILSIPTAQGASIENKARGKVENIAPMETVRGYLAGNADGTYFPGDFLTARVLVKSNGKRGRAVKDKWKRYDRKSQITSEKPWYDKMKHVDDKIKGQWYANRGNAVDQKEDKLDEPDVIDAGVERRCTDRDFRAWWIYDGETDKNYSQWYETATNAAVKRNQMEGKENVKNAGLDSKVDKSSCKWRTWWIDRDWKVRLLKLKPEAVIYVYSTNPDVEENIEYHPWVLRLEEGKTVTGQVYVKLGVTTDPGRYKVKLSMTPPSKGHYNPYEDVKPIEFQSFFEVVEYNPVIRRIPYLCPFWRPRTTSWMIQKPNAVVTKYEGSRSENTYWRGWWKLENSSYKGYTRWFRSRGKAKSRRRELVNWIPRIVESTGVENSNIAPKRRTVISGMSLEGSVTKPLHANHMFQRGVIGSCKPAFENTNVPPKNIRVSSSGNLTLAEKPNGDYYHGGTVVSSVMKVPRQMEDVPPTWIKGTTKVNTPGGTHVKVYVRFGSSVAEVRRTREWVPVGSLKDNAREGDYGQYRAVLYTEDSSSAPTLKKVKFRVLNAGQAGEFYWAQKNWSGGPGHLLPENTSEFVNPKWIQGGYYTYRDPMLYQKGDTILRSSGVPRTGKVNLVPKNPAFRRLGPHSSVLLELKPKELPEDLKEKTSTMKFAPPRSYVRLEDVKFRPGHREANGKKVFVFARKGRGPTYTKVREEPSLKYGIENRYKKWRLFFYPRDFYPNYRYPRVERWFEDATVRLNVTYWFHQMVSRNDFEWETLKPAFSSKVRWFAMADYQPVRVSTWELKPWAEDELTENPKVVLQDNAWRVDERVHFRFKFVSMQSPENFLRMTKETAQFLGEENMLGLKTYSKARKGAESLGLSLGKIPKIKPREISQMRKALLSVAHMDNEMVRMVLEDLKFENNGPQFIRGRGSDNDNVEYRIGGYFAVKENAWISGEGVEENLAETTILPFDPDRRVKFNINLSGEGLAADIVRDTPSYAKIRIYDPPRSGGLKYVKVKDNGGETLMTENYARETFGKLPLFGTGGEKGGWHEFTFEKWKGSPMELTLVLTNEWNATTTQTVYVSSGKAPGGGIGFQMSWKWVVLGILAAIAWVAIVRKWREEKGGKKKKKRYHPPF